MRKINPKSSDTDSFKYSILISLHYYDISFHPERIPKLKTFEKQNNFIHINIVIALSEIIILLTHSINC